MSLTIPIIYTIFMVCTFYLLSFTKSKYFQTVQQRINAIVVLNALLIPIPCFLYYMSLDSPLGYDYIVDAPIKALIGMTIAYSLFSTFCYFAHAEKRDYDIIFHHAITTLFFTIVLFIKSLPAYWMLFMMIQFNGFFYHTHVILKETEGVSKATANRWYDWNVYMWFVLRIVFQSIWLLGGIYYEFTNPKLTTSIRVFVFFGVGFMFFFGFNWFHIMLKNRKKMKAYKE